MRESHRKVNYLGITITVLTTIGFILAVREWIMHNDWPRSISSKEARSNEIRAYKNMQKIIRAQKKYRETDWDEDGEKTYAQFLIQLWRTITIDNKYVDVKFINKNFGFAMGQTKAIHGYFYDDLHSRSVQDKQIRPFDYKNEWAITGIPEIYQATGSLVFLTDQTEKIFVKQVISSQNFYPHDPQSKGWILINSIEELKEFQENISDSGIYTTD